MESCRRLIAVLGVIVWLPAQATPGATVTADFDSGISPYLWRVVRDPQAGPASWTVAAPDGIGRLEISKPADNDEATAHQTIGGSVRSRLALDGDFTVSVDFALPIFPDAGLGYNEAILGVQARNTGAAFLSLRFVIGSTQYAEGYGTHPAEVPYGQILDGSTAGRFRITRVGQTMTAWYDRGAGFSILGSATDSAYLGPMEIDLWAAQVVRTATGHRSFSALDVRFDNFSATADTIIRDIPGDTDLDGDVDFRDYQLLEAYYGESGPHVTWGMGDFDRDHDVDFADYQALEANFGTSIPEPAALSLLALGGAALLRRCRGFKG